MLSSPSRRWATVLLAIAVTILALATESGGTAEREPTWSRMKSAKGGFTYSSRRGSSLTGQDWNSRRRDWMRKFESETSHSSSSSSSSHSSRNSYSDYQRTLQRSVDDYVALPEEEKLKVGLSNDCVVFQEREVSILAVIVDVIKRSR